MKRYYRNRIILGAMASFLFLLVIAVSGIGLSSYHQLESETDDFIASLLDGSEDRPGTFRQPPPFSFFGYTHGQRRFLSGLYDLSLSEDGRILRMDGHGLTEDEDAEATVQQLVLQALQLGADKGKIEAYKYAMRRMEDGTIRFILLDMSIQLQSLYNMLENALMGLCGESGEAIDLLKKHRFQGHPLDTEKLKKELGDVAWYLAEAAQGLNVPLSEILQGNLNKLHGRYPNGFSSERSMHRENAE